MNPQAINLQNKFGLITEHWSPKNIAQLNDYHFKLVKVQGEFVWHTHPETDEVFIVFQGPLEIHLRDGKVVLNSGEMCVIPKGLEHKPYAAQECQVMLVEPVGTVNTGDVGGERTAANDQWI